MSNIRHSTVRPIESKNFHPFLFFCGGFRPFHRRLHGGSVLRGHVRLARPFLKVRSTAQYRLWGCLAALIPDALNTLDPRQFQLPFSHYMSWKARTSGNPISQSGVNNFFFQTFLRWRTKDVPKNVQKGFQKDIQKDVIWYLNLAFSFVRYSVRTFMRLFVCSLVHIFVRTLMRSFLRPLF